MEIEMETESEDRPKFSFMEILIIVVVLGICTSIVTPRFSHAAKEAKLSEMVSDLQNMRSQIALYRIQHNDLLPGQNVVDGDIDESDFVAALTLETSDGLGPYIKQMPANPFNDMDSVIIVTADPQVQDNSGWFFNSKTGEFRANDSVIHSAY